MERNLKLTLEVASKMYKNAANELKQRSLSPLLIQQQFIEKWDGKTPLYGNVPTFFKNVN